jgi:hypothetical protein
MALVLKKKLSKPEDELSRSTVEWKKLMARILQQDNRYGAKSTLTLGQPESCKTSVTCSIAEYHMIHHPESYLFWRSALNAPIQIFKLPKWKLYTEENSGVRFYDRSNGNDITDGLREKNQLVEFTDIYDLMKKARPGICNGVFFKDLHMKKVDKDEGTIQWFNFIRHLLHSNQWYYVFLDEYQEMAKTGASENLWKEINNHSDDVSSARKANVGIHANAHQTTELDYRVLTGFMIIIQMYGARTYKHSMVTKKAIAALRKPDERYGADAWISEGSHFGRGVFKKVYVLPDGWDIEARIKKSDEKIKLCPMCNHEYIYKRIDQIYCSSACKMRDVRRKKRNISVLAIDANVSPVDSSSVLEGDDEIF